MVQQGYKLSPSGRKTASGPSVIYLKMDSSIQKKVPLVSDKKLNTLILVFECYNISTPTSVQISSYF